MNKARIAILGVALVAAIGAAFLARSLLSAPNEVETQIVVEAPVSKVLVANADLPIGHRISGGDLDWQEWPETAVTPLYLLKETRPDAIEKLNDAIVRTPIAKGEPVTDRKLVTVGSAGFMSALLSPGMRAISVPVSPETGAGGFILPNDRVDLILTREGGGGDGGGEDSFSSETILSNVRVLAIDQTFKEVEGTQVVVGKTATLELTPGQTETLALAKAMGGLSLTLRSLADSSAVAHLGPQTSRGLRGNLEPDGRRKGAITIVRYGQPSTIQVRSAP